MQYVIDTVQPSHHERAVDIWSIAFSIFGLRQRMLQYPAQLSLLLGAYDDNGLQAVAGCMDYELHFGDRWIPCAGIAGVSTDPAHRRQGAVRQLLTSMMQRLYEQRMPVAMLWPFSHPFYAQMGWSVCSFKYTVECKPSVLPNQGDARRYRLIACERYSDVMPMHDRWVAQHNMSLKRNERRWERLMTDPYTTGALYVHADGYMLLDFSKGKEGLLVVKEWASTTHQSFIDGLSLLSQMDSQFEKVQWTCADPEPLHRLGLTDPKPHVQMSPGTMIRVVHPESFREYISVKSPEVRIRDPLGVSGSADELNGSHPGELVQHVIGLWKQPSEDFPLELHGVAGGAPCFTAEFF